MPMNAEVFSYREKRAKREHRKNLSPATAQELAQGAALIEEVQRREMMQMRERNHRHDDLALRRLWQHFPEGVGLVMRAAETARTGHWYRGGSPFLLTAPELIALMIRSEGRCELTGLLFNGEEIPGCSKRPYIPSIDRMSAKEPYLFKNCRLICWAVNRAIGDWGDDVFWKIALNASDRIRKQAGIESEP